jgi:hypothetical protein
MRAAEHSSREPLAVSLAGSCDREILKWRKQRVFIDEADQAIYFPRVYRSARSNCLSDRAHLL